MDKFNIKTAIIPVTYQGYLENESVFPIATASINSAIYRILAKGLKLAQYIPVEYLAYVGKTINLIARQEGSNYINLAII